MIPPYLVIFLVGWCLVWFYIGIDSHKEELPPSPPTPDPRPEALVRVELTPEQLERDSHENWMARFRAECGDPNQYLTVEERLRNETYQPGGM